MSKKSASPLLQLGRPTPVPPSPDQALLEKIPCPYPQHDYLVRFVCPEFTSLCPITGQPDFAHFVIDYVPRKWIVESKSLKLYLQSFRNHGDFHEACTVGIGDRLLTVLKPQWIRISAYWYPRGGMPIDVFFQKGTLPKNMDVPATGVASYRGRG